MRARFETFLGRGRRIYVPALAVVTLVLLLAGCTFASTDGWEQVGASGRHIVLSLAADPFTTRIYAGTDGGIIYRLRVDGTGQPEAGVGLPASAVVAAILPDAHTRGLVYAGCSHGLYVSTDGGDHWSPRGSGFPAEDTMSALIAGADQQTLLAGSQEHSVFISHDQGMTWQSAAQGLPTKANIYTLLRDPASHFTYAAVDGIGLFASQDDGRTWSSRSTGLPAHIFALAVLPARGIEPLGATLYAGTERGLYASTDDGANWQPTGTVLRDLRVLSLAPDTSRPGVLYAGLDSTVARTSDGGRTWGAVAPGLKSHIAALLVTRGVDFAGGDGLYRYPPRGGATLGNVLVNLIFVLLLALLGFIYFWRSRARRLKAEQRRLQRATNGEPDVPTDTDVARNDTSSTTSPGAPTRDHAHSDNLH